MDKVKQNIWVTQLSGKLAFFLKYIICPFLWKALLYVIKISFIIIVFKEIEQTWHQTLTLRSTGRIMESVMKSETSSKDSSETGSNNQITSNRTVGGKKILDSFLRIFVEYIWKLQEMQIFIWAFRYIVIKIKINKFFK